MGKEIEEFITKLSYQSYFVIPQHFLNNKISTMAKEKITLDKLSPEEKAALKKELEQEQKTESERIRKERAQYKQLVDEAVKVLFPVLKEVNKALADAKRYVYDNLDSLTKMKSELYDREDDQFSHSFSSADGSITIIIGCNVSDGWDDTVDVGIGKVNDYLQSLITDKKSKDLVDTVMKLLSKDSKGNLKASRVLQLKQLAEKNGDKKFMDAINIIQDAYKPVKSKEFVRCIYKNEKGENTILPLSITDAEMPAKETV